MPDLGSAFTRATAYTHAPGCRRLLHKPAATLLYATLLRRPRCVPFALQVPHAHLFEEEMRIVLPEGSACETFFHDSIEDVTSFLLTRVTEGMTFIGVGANLSYFSLLAATLVGPSGQVHAFEPAQGTCDMLRHNTCRHGHITVQQKALWACWTTLPFHECDRWYSALNSVRNHRLTRESDLALRRPYPFEAITLEVRDDPARNSRDDIVFLMLHGYEALEYHADAIIPYRLRDSHESTNLLFIHPRKTQSPAPGHAVAEDSETAIHESGS
jgi:FkbM family methyltransferase